MPPFRKTTADFFVVFICSYPFFIGFERDKPRILQIAIDILEVTGIIDFAIFHLKHRKLYGHFIKQKSPDCWRS